MDFKFFNKFIVRSPLLSLEDITKIDETKLINLFNRNYVKEAIFLASPTFFDIIQNKIDKNEKLNKNEIITLSKYIIRMGSRCTPFGLFSGISLGNINNYETSINCKENQYKYYSKVGLDVNFLCSIVYKFENDDKIKSKLKYYPNNSIYKIGDEVRYVEYVLKKFWREHFIISIDNSKYLKKVLKSSIVGTVSYLQIWTENQMIATGDEVFVVVPAQEGKYLGKLTAKAQNSGKIEKNQQVNIRLANFPDREYGIINGKIEHIAATPDKEGNLLIDVVLPNGLQTSYQKNITFKQEMTGTADIITQDLRLIDRILFQFRSMVKR